jgi:hypothetical protein
MTIRLNAEEEQLIGRAIQAGLIGQAHDVVAAGVDALRQRMQSRERPGFELPTDEWLREFRTWVHSHPTTTPPLSDEAIGRDSIYGTRGV